MRYAKLLTPSPTVAISALFATFELCKSYAMHREVATNVFSLSYYYR